MLKPLQQRSSQPARSCFEHAVTWGLGEDAIVDLFVAMHRTGQQAEAVAMVGRYKDQFPALSSLGRLKTNPMPAVPAV